jgi:hypothetical protein
MILLFTSTKINYEEYSICKSTIDNMFNKVNIPMDLSSLIKDQRYKTIKTQKTWWSDNFYLQILAFPNLCLLCLSQRCPRTLWVACRSQSNHRLVISDGVPPWLVDVVFRDASTYTPVCLTGMCDLAHSCVGKKTSTVQNRKTLLGTSSRRVDQNQCRWCFHGARESWRWCGDTGREEDCDLMGLAHYHGLRRRNHPSSRMVT